MIDDLTEDNFIMYAMKAYSSPHYVMSEFEGDLKRTKYLKRLFRRYKITKSIKERLIEAERERIKMQTLADQNAAAVQKDLNKREQKKMDDMGVMQFNLQPQH